MLSAQPSQVNHDGDVLCWDWGWYMWAALIASLCFQNMHFKIYETILQEILPQVQFSWWHLLFIFGIILFLFFQAGFLPSWLTEKFQNLSTKNKFTNIPEEEVQGEGCYVRSPHKMAIFMMFCSGIGVGVFGLFLAQMYSNSSCPVLFSCVNYDQP